MIARLSRRGAAVGLAAGSISVALMFGLRLLLGIEAFPDVAADALTLLLPGGVFGLLIDRLQEFGRPTLLTGLAVGLLVLCALVGAVSVGALPRTGRFAVAVAVPTALTVPLVFLGAEERAVAPAAATIGYWVVYALLLDLGVSAPAAARVFPSAHSPTRRALLYGAGALAAVWLSAYLGGRLAHAARLGGTRPVTRATPPPAPSASGPEASGGAAAGEPPDPFANATGLTPTPDFYVISKNGLDDPTVDGARWRLQVGGERPYSLTYEQLRALPHVEFAMTLQCISNLVGGGLISTAIFRGVPLRDLLDRAGAPGGTREIRFACADGYTESLPLETVNDPRTIVAYLMNGEPLTKEHGFPARIILAGRYGMKQPKWLTTIAPLNAALNGYWEVRGWSKDAFALTVSKIDNPGPDATVPAGKPYPFMNGVAFAGARGISKVELSFDGGKTWTEARLRRLLPKDNWMPWTYVWTPPAPGRYALVVRAYDGEGRSQDPAERDSFPNGATGYHRLTVSAV